MPTPRFHPHYLVNVISGDQKIPAEVLGVQYVVPTFFYVVRLEEPIEAEFGSQEGLFVPESSLVTRTLVESWISIGSYVYTYDEEDELKAVDIQVLVGKGSDDRWYAKITDEIDGDDPWDDPFDTFEDAKSFTEDHILNNNEAEPGETAVAYLERLGKQTD